MEENQQEQPQPSVLRSINNIYRSFVRFINDTKRKVAVYWIDYQGQAVSYGVLCPNQYLDINTFVTHPWIFVDAETRERYVVNQRDVFFPRPWFLDEEVSVLAPHRCVRTAVFITLPVYTLRELCLRVIKGCLKHDWQAFLLDIPRSLQYELAAMLLADAGDQDRNS